MQSHTPSDTEKGESWTHGEFAELHKTICADIPNSSVCWRHYFNPDSVIEDITRRRNVFPFSFTGTLERLKRTGTWVSLLITFSYVYGSVTVARLLTPDPRQSTWLLMLSPIPTIALTLLFVGTVTWWGPRYMSNRKPIEGLRPYMMVYNTFQVFFSAWLFWEVKLLIYILFCCILYTSDNIA